MKTTFITAMVGAVLSVAGCRSDKYMVVAPNATTGKHEIQGLITEWEAFQRDENRDFHRELGGEKPLAGFETWASYWEWRYSSLREHSAEKEIRWIKQRRQELGLPSYE
jgi:hypothetical protein